MIRGIHHVAINVADFDRMADFYRRAFGFEEMPGAFAWADNPDYDRVLGVPGSKGRVTMFRAGASFLELFQYSAPPARDAPPLRPNDRGYTHFCVILDDMDTEFERLKREGMTFVADRPGHEDGMRGIYGADPEGNVIELLELPPGHVWTL
ncbi:hypothetical protein ACFB49_13580 [Sphingomonas sp. DBB INV C78]|uniref:VOC family protein n=1 Tax=Sphingomonas sp. DBB INV C78 TaxID=3349434 RepID=UPI0036D245D7